jgi:hypothetical protein
MQIVQIKGVWYTYSWATGYVKINFPQKEVVNG